MSGLIEKPNTIGEVFCDSNGPEMDIKISTSVAQDLNSSRRVIPPVALIFWRWRSPSDTRHGQASDGDSHVGVFACEQTK